MDVDYPAGPAEVPAGLTAPSVRYRRQAWLAMAGLVVFIGVYFALASWFGWTAYRLLSGLSHARGEVLPILIAGVGSAFLAAFMVKALLFVKRGEAVEDLEVTAADEPRLFAFLNRLADDVGAPRPHRVYLSGRVNAAVFYDLSIANFILPSQKNLEIGLALVNVLPLGELKAVLAHEFGHFAQRTMAVGRWVYLSQQIAAHIVGRRDAFDAFLAKLSGIDIRIAWIAWILRLVIWAIRSVIDLLFRVVVLAQRALSREMEFQADLVSVSVTGSDALIHALHRLGAADSAWTRTLAFASSELAAKRGVVDLFAIQQRVIERVRAVLADEAYGAVPPVPAGELPKHRLFKAALAAPPTMWSTHPSNSDREENAKRVYVAASVDERSAWTVFADPQALRERLSRHLVRSTEFTPVPIGESLERLDAEYRHAYYDRAYRGTYLGRSIVRHGHTAAELYGEAPSSVQLALERLYPESLEADFERLRELEQEKQLLAGLRARSLSAAGGVIRHRGATLSRRDLPRVIAQVEAEIEAVADGVRAHDRLCRATHVAAAATLDAAWTAYLKEQLRLLHYVEHAAANLNDARATLGATLRHELAGGKLRRAGRENILKAAGVAFEALKSIYDDAPQVVLDAPVRARLGCESWAASLEELKLPAPTSANLGNWLNAIDSWMNSILGRLEPLRLASLEELLLAETRVAAAARSGAPAGAAPEPPRAPATYGVLVPGSERPKPEELRWWDRFQLAAGPGPLLARVAAAAAVIGIAVWIGGAAGSSSVFVHNGLGRVVSVRLGKGVVRLPAFGHAEVDVGSLDSVHVTTTTGEGEPIEEFDAELPGSSSHTVYNVASAGVLVSWTAAYGETTVAPPVSLGAPRWIPTTAQVVLDPPPRSVRTKGGPTTRSVLTGLAAEPPENVLAPLAPHPDEIDRVIAAHARWDQGGVPGTRAWIALAAKRLATFADVVRARLKDDPADAFNFELEQATTGGAAREAACARQREVARAYPRNVRLQAVVLGCAGAAASLLAQPPP